MNPLDRLGWAALALMSGSFALACAFAVYACPEANRAAYSALGLIWAGFFFISYRRL